MKLDLTVNEKVINKVFSNNPEDYKVKERITNHKIIASDELKSIWEKEAKDNGYHGYFMAWFTNKIRSRECFEKVNISDIDEIIGTEDHNEKVLVCTANQSKDKIVVGTNRSTLVNNNKNIRFIPERQINANRNQEITISDIQNVFVNNRLEKLFDIYETPVTIRTAKNQDAEILGKYLSRFYKNASSIVIKDAYLDDMKNERNLNDYVLKYINKENTDIKFVLLNKESKSKFESYKGYNTSVNICHKDDDHVSFIETEDYRIILGYRLLTFGIGGKISKEDVITITKKNTR